MLTDRQRKVITCILKHPKGIYAATIAEELKVSDRTVRNDIASINMILLNSHCMIQSSKRTGYFIMQENISRIRECLSLMDAVDGKQIASTPMERKYFMLGQLFENYEMSLSQVADLLYVSEQTIYKDLTSLIQLLKNKYHFQALNLENGKICIDRDEVELRTLFYRIAKEEIYSSNKLMDLHLFQLTKDYVDLEELNGIVDYVSCFCKGNAIILSDQLIYVISWMIFFTMIRVENEHRIEKEVQLFHHNEVLTRMLRNLLADLRLRFEETDIHLLQNYVETLGFYSSRQSNQLGNESDDIADEFIRQMKEKYNYDFTSMPSLLDNFRIHLQFAIKRLLVDYQLTNPLLQEVKTKYAFAYEITMLIVPIIYERYGLYMNEDEISFLTMYVMPFLKAQSIRVPTILINGTSQSFANLLHIWLKQEFRDKLEIVCQIPLQQLPSALQEQTAELVISDMVLDQALPLPLIEITQLPGEAERRNIEKFLSRHVAASSSEVIFHKVFDRRLVLLIDDDQSFDSIIHQCAKRLEQEDRIENAQAFAAAVLQRESVYPTYIDNGVFFPHPLINDAKRSSICVALIRGNCVEKDQPARLLFVGSHESQINKEMVHIYHLINKVAASSQLLNVLMSMQDENELIDYLERIIQIV
ncbi:BglG family transcription antiterminator [Merdibacter massiliensis]|uniref:BglG family transcription antiterminator n=1 Tax=Merdibacter massiliensis TaxID=1871030 RepID=UPI00096A89D1|nr:PRD domain-containing protein [Merdibacter massiliensis]